MWMKPLELKVTLCHLAAVSTAMPWSLFLATNWRVCWYYAAYWRTLRSCRLDSIQHQQCKVQIIRRSHPQWSQLLWLWWTVKPFWAWRVSALLNAFDFDWFVYAVLVSCSTSQQPQAAAGCGNTSGAVCSMWIPPKSTMPVGLLDQHHHTISRYPVALLGFVLYCFSARRSSSLFLFIMSGMAAIAQERGGYWQDCLHIWIHAAEGQHGPMGALQVTWTFCRWGHLLTHAAFMYFDIFWCTIEIIESCEK